MKYTSLIYGCFIFSLLSCTFKSNKEVPNSHVEVVKDGDGNLKYEICYIQDTIEHGISKYYYPHTNVLKDEISFQYGKKEGWHKHYRPDGTLESKVHFEDNKQNGLTYWYHKDGEGIIEKSNWKGGRPYGNAVFYYPNGTLRLFNAVDAFNETFFVIKWDSLGNRTYDEGMVFSPQFLSNLRSSEIFTSDTLKLNITVAEPPETKAVIYMGELGDELESIEVHHSTACFLKTFNRTGIHTILTIGEIYDLQGNLIKRDSISTELTVLE